MNSKRTDLENLRDKLERLLATVDVIDGDEERFTLIFNATPKQRWMGHPTSFSIDLNRHTQFGYDFIQFLQAQLETITEESRQIDEYERIMGEKHQAVVV